MKHCIFIQGTLGGWSYDRLAHFYPGTIYDDTFHLCTESEQDLVNVDISDIEQGGYISLGGFFSFKLVSVMFVMNNDEGAVLLYMTHKCMEDLLAKGVHIAQLHKKDEFAIKMRETWEQLPSVGKKGVKFALESTPPSGEG